MNNSHNIPCYEFQFKVEQFYYCEAELLDDRNYGAWLELMDPAVFYHMPIKRNVSRQNTSKEISSTKEIAHFEENFDTLRRRIDRLNSSVAWTEQPAARTRRIISNVRIQAPEVGQELAVKSNFVLHGDRLEEESFCFTGERQDVLRYSDGKFRVARRRILMDQAVIRASSISILF